ncbi:MAG: hypothetical protein IIY88_07230 [Eubacterium sp.]|nr:hypothetical protein [Eubacterium sp.]
MTWLKVILLAVGTAIVTAVFLIFPVFRNTSFERMGVHLEAWFLFAIIIMSNCKKPLESAVKTFVFFLVSQPLIYLIQVPFTELGWGIFGYYKYWFIATLLTFPMAFIGWYITRKDWLSLIIILPVLGFLGYTALEAFSFTSMHFPYHLVTALFCVLQILLYLAAFTSDKRQVIIGILVPVVAAAAIFLRSPGIDINGTNFLPDDPVLTEQAVVETDGSGLAEISIASTGESSMIGIRAKEYGTMEFTIKDGDAEYPYTLELYEDEGGHPQIRITPR